MYSTAFNIILLYFWFPLKLNFLLLRYGADQVLQLDRRIELSSDLPMILEIVDVAGKSPH